MSLLTIDLVSGSKEKDKGRVLFVSRFVKALD